MVILDVFSIVVVCGCICVFLHHLLVNDLWFDFLQNTFYFLAFIVCDLGIVVAFTWLIFRFAGIV